MHKRWISLLLALVMVLGLASGGAITASAASEMKASESLIALIKQFEGFSSKPILDYSQWSVGYGSACNSGDYPNGITVEEADKLLRADVAKFETTINDFATKYNLSLKQNQFDALVSFTYNVGQNWVNDSEGAFRNAVVSGATGSDFLYAIVRWSMAGSGDNKTVQTHLVNRRLAEANLYLNGIYSNGHPANYTYVIYNNNITDCTNTVRIQGYDSTGTVQVRSTPSKSGYRFLGWYTAATGGQPVSELNASTATMTVYGHWQEGDGARDESGNVIGVAASYTRYAAVSGTQLSYAQPSTAAAQVATLTANQELKIVADYMDAAGVLWGKCSDGGWVDLSGSATELQPTNMLSEPVEVTVTSGGVNLRAGPGTNYAKVGTTQKDQKLTIVGTQKGTYYNWGKFDGGWICLDYTDFESVLADKSEDANKVTAIGTVIGANKLNIRSGPGTSYSTVGSYSIGEQMYITLQKKVGDTVWYKTEKGWVHSFYIKATAVAEGTVPDLTPTEPTTPDETTPDGSDSTETTADTGIVVNCYTLRIRANAGTEYSHIGDLTQGTQVTITEYTTVRGIKWGKISQGWVCMDYIQLVQNSGSDSTVTGVTGVVVNCAKVNIRSNAGTQYSKVGELAKGTTVQILETAKATNGATWARTSLGWIHTHYLQMTTTNGTGGSTGSSGSTDSDTTGSGTTGVVVNCTKVNIRSNPGTQYSNVGQLTAGTVVQILETAKATNGATWARTSLGWIHTYYLQITTSGGTGGTTGSDSGSGSTDTGTGDSGSDGSGIRLTGTVVNTDVLRVRSAAGVSNTAVGTMVKGERVEIYETTIVNRTTWGRTAKGWISLFYVQLDTATSVEGTSVMIVNTDTLRIRESAGTGYKQVGSYFRGNQVVILEQTTVDGAAWGRTDKGWVAMEYLK